MINYDHFWALPLFGAVLCHAINIKTKGIVIMAVAISTGCNALVSTLEPMTCKKGIGYTVKIQKPIIIPKMSLFLFKTE
jgi:hypothetical protein